MALTYNELQSIGTEFIIPEIQDNWYLESPELFDMKDMAEKQGGLLDGGQFIKQPIIYRNQGNAAGQNVIWFTGNTPLPADPRDTFTAAKYEWRFVSSGLAVNHTDIWLNEGKTGIVKLLEHKKTNAVNTLMEFVATALNGAQAGISMDGLDDVMSAASTYGGIAVADMARWAALVETPAANTLTFYALTDFIYRLSETGKEKDKPTVGVTTAAVIAKIRALFQAQQRFPVEGKKERFLNAGWSDQVVVEGVPFIVSPYAAGGGSTTATHEINFINSRYLQMRLHKNVNFRILPPREPYNQAMTAIFILAALNLSCSYRKRQGRLQSINPSL